ncbi:hypothetical protein D5086_013902 [Populus alba]|uniref:Uncharacterized protein n=1 Tax=Populus alba TaxID=43335 RepID=A0ACC4C6A9_POPAL
MSVSLAAGFNNLTSIDYHNQDTKTKKTPKSRVFIVVGAISAALVVVLLSILLVFWKNHMKKRARQPIASSRRLNCLHCYLASCPQHRKSEESMVSSIGSDKATILPYNEIREATSNFSRSLIIGQGSYGLVYLGKIRGTIELIGYVAGGESLFLVYEFAQNGALSNHLHNPALRALSKDASPENEELSKHRSVVQYMLSALNDSQESFDELAKCIDLNLTSYNKDSLYEMALLSKDCVDDNWKRRPDMSRVVLRLSHLLSSSREHLEIVEFTMPLTICQDSSSKRVEAEIREGIDIRICQGGNVKVTKGNLQRRRGLERDKRQPYRYASTPNTCPSARCSSPLCFNCILRFF